MMMPTVTAPRRVRQPRILGGMVTGSARSPQLMRRLNSDALVRFALDVDEFTAAEAMSATALARPTVLDVCEALVSAGWLEEIADSRVAGLTNKGRPAKRYRLRERGGILLGLDAGGHRFTAVAATLKGRVLADRSVTAPVVSTDPDLAERRAAAEARRALCSQILADVARDAGRDVGDALIAVIGVPAPVDAHGRSPDGEHEYWRTMNPGFDGLLGSVPVVVDNDANLAAVAERARGGHPDDIGVATVLAGERLGAGVILDGHLLRGSRGGVGEMRFLQIVEGVGNTDGIGALAREWGREVLGEHVDSDDVFRAAESGHPAALGIVERLGERIARVAEALSSLLDIDRVVIAGAIAESAAPVLSHAADVLTREFQDPIPDLVASRLGPDIVVTGAVEAALDRIRASPGDFSPR